MIEISKLVILGYILLFSICGAFVVIALRDIIIGKGTIFDYAILMAALGGTSVLGIYFFLVS